MNRDDVRMVRRPLSVAALAEALEVKGYQLMKELIGYRVFAMNDQYIVSDEVAMSLAGWHHLRLIIVEPGATRITKRPVTVKKLAKELQVLADDLIKDLALRNIPAEVDSEVPDMEAIALAGMRGIRLVIEK